MKLIESQFLGTFGESTQGSTQGTAQIFESMSQRIPEGSIKFLTMSRPMSRLKGRHKDRESTQQLLTA